MGDHCQYVVFPDGGRAPFVVPTHPYPEHISDDLGGAMVSSAIVLPPARCMMWVREDAATTGYRKNIVASVLATLSNDWRRPTLVVGPAVLTVMQVVSVDPMTGGVEAAGDGFDGAVARALATVAADVQLALSGSNGPFQTSGLPDGWSAKVRAFASHLEAMPIADDWPASENRPKPYDHISAALEARHPGTRMCRSRPID